MTVRFYLMLVLIGGVLSARTSTAVDLYAGADIAFTRLPIGGADFTSYAAKVRAGGSLANGLGVELQAVVGLGDDNIANLALKLDNTVGVFARYETPADADFQFFILAGYATTSLALVGSGTAGIDDSYSGFAWGIGAQETVRWLPGTTAVVEFNSYYADDELDVWSLSMGLRYDF